MWWTRPRFNAWPASSSWERVTSRSEARSTPGSNIRSAHCTRPRRWFRRSRAIHAADVEIEPAARRLARLGSLLHDLPHVPFGHTLEDEFQLLKRHDVNEERINALLRDGEIGAILRERLGEAEFDELQAVLFAKSDDDFAQLQFPFVGDIVGNTVCADLLDYVRRDLTACGMPVALGERFLDYLTLTTDDEGRPVDRRRVALNLDKAGMPRPDVESEVVKLLEYRYELAERVYFHHSKNAASVMIGRAVQEAGFAAGEDGPLELDENFRRLSDELLLHALAEPELEKALSLATAEVGDRKLAASLAQRVIARDLYKIAYLAVHDDVADGVARITAEYGQPTGRRLLENDLADRAGLPGGAVLVHVPREKMMTKNADVRVRTSVGEVITLNDWDARHSRRVLSLNEAHRRLWHVTVYVDPKLADDTQKELVASAAHDFFGAPSRYRRPKDVPNYLRTLFHEMAPVEGFNFADEAALSEVAADATMMNREQVEARIRDAVALYRLSAGEPATGEES